MRRVRFIVALMSRRRDAATRLFIACLVAALACSFFIIVGVKAQQPANPTVQSGVLGPQGTFVIRNARIVTVSGADIENGSVVIRNGRIEAVGANATAPAGAEEINGQGLSVYPGMIDLGTAIGLVEVGNGAPGTVDTTEVGDFNPNAQAIVAINPHSAYVGVARVNGVTTVMSQPQGGLIAGQGALINLNGTSPREMAVVQNAALIINFPRVATQSFDFFNVQQIPITEAITTRDRQVEQLRKMLRDAQAYAKAQDAYARDNTLPRPDVNVVLASLRPYVRGELPVIFRADREREIRAAVNFAEEMHLKPIIMGGTDAWKITDFLKSHNVPVILTSILDLPLREDDPYDTNYSSAGKLQQAGVRFCISTGDTGQFVRNLPLFAGMAVSFGMSREEALKAITLYPAQIMGLADRMGSIDVGKMANLVITDGDLLDARTHVRDLFIDGRRIPLVSRHTELYDMFKNRR